MDAGMAAQIAQLRALSRQQLLDMWQKLYDRAAPPGIRRELLVPFLAYRMQEHACGGLKSSERSELRRIARVLEKSSGSTRLIRPDGFLHPADFLLDLPGDVLNDAFGF